MDGLQVVYIAVSWATFEDGLEERDTLYEEARTLDKKRTLFTVKGGQCEDAADIAGLVEQIDESNSTFGQGTKRKRQEMEAEVELHAILELKKRILHDEPQWTNVIEEIDAEGVNEENHSDNFGDNNIQLPENLHAWHAASFLYSHYTSGTPEQHKKAN